MSRPLNHDCTCDPALIFEFADGALSPGHEKEVRHHLANCPGCRELYEREERINVHLGSLNFAAVNSRSVCESVAMALPTRTAKARLLWAFLATILLATALFALGSQGANPTTFVMGAVESFQGVSMMLGDFLGTALAAVGSMVLIALAVGATLDLLIAAVLLSVVRRRTREA